MSADVSTIRVQNYVYNSKTGALTEVNWNIYSDDNQINVAGAFYGAKTYRISIALDLMVTDTETTEVVMADTGHSPYIEKPQEFYAHFSAFLKQNA